VLTERVQLLRWMFHDQFLILCTIVWLVVFVLMCIVYCCVAVAGEERRREGGVVHNC
jgi:heme/copper-type cytochrome/quinol oxidase subunit 2